MLGFVPQSGFLSQGVLLASAAGAETLLDVAQEIDAGLARGASTIQILDGLRSFEAALAEEGEFEELASEHRMLTLLLGGGISGSLGSPLQVLRNSIVARVRAAHPEIARDRLGETPSPSLTPRVVRPSTARLQVIAPAGQEDRPFCGTCNTFNEPDSSYCRQCGMKLVEQAEIEIEPEMRKVTVLFTDLVGFTDAMSRMDARQTFDFVNAHVSRLGALIVKHGGQYNKTMADAMMGVFGAPRTYENHAERAVEAALEILDELQILNAELGRRGLPRLQMRIGIHTGWVAAGVIREPMRQQYDVLGAVVNLASRTESFKMDPGADQTALADLPVGDRIVITEATRAELAGLFDVQPIGPVSLKGVPQPVSMFRVLGKNREQAIIRARGEDRAGFRGRDAELASVCQTWRETLEGRARFQLIVGVAGQGKSRLVTEFLGTVEDQRGFLFTKGIERESHPPYYYIAQALIHAARITPQDTPEERATKVRALTAKGIRGEGVAAETAAQLLGHLMGCPFENRSEEMEYLLVHSAELRDRIETEVVRFFRGYTQRHPVILVLEDIQWADAPSLSLMEQLLIELKSSPFMVLGAARPQYFDNHPHAFSEEELDDTRAQTVPLRTLPGDTMTEIASELVGEAIAAGERDEAVAFIVAQSAGNPFVLYEMARAARAGWLRRDAVGQGWQFVGPDNRPILPGIDSFMQSLVGWLDPEERQAIDTAAILGNDIGAEKIGALARMDPTRVLARLVAKEFLVRQDDGLYVFRHDRLRETVLTMMSDHSRQSHHAAVARYYHDEEPANHAVIAEHFRQAGDTEHAASHYYEAGRHAASVEALYATAEQFFQMAHDLAKPVQRELALKAILAWNETQHAQRKYEEARSTIREARLLIGDQVLPDKDLHGRYYLQRALTILENARLTTGEERIGLVAEAESTARQGLALFAETEHAESECRLWLLLAQIEIHERRRFNLAENYEATALTTARALQNNDLVIEAEMSGLYCAIEHADYIALIHLAERIDTSLRAPEHADKRIFAQHCLASAYFYLGDYEKARRHWETARLLSERFGKVDLGKIVLNLGATAWARGEPDEALRHLEETLSLYADRPTDYYVAAAHLLRSLVQLECQRYPDARREAEQAMTLAEYNDDNKVRAFTSFARAQLALAEGDEEEAWEWSQRAYGILRDAGWNIEWFDLEILLIHTRILQRRGEVHEAWQVIRRAKSMLDQRARRIGDPTLKASYLSRVRTNFAISELWSDLQGRVVADNEVLRGMLDEALTVLPRPLPEELVGYGQGGIGEVSPSVPIGHSQMAGVLIDSPSIPVLRRLLTTPVLIAKNSGPFRQVWASRIQWRPVVEGESPVAYVEFDLTAKGRVQTFLRGLLTMLSYDPHMRLRLLGEYQVDRAAGTIRLTFHIDEEYSPLTRDQFGEVEFTLAPLSGEKTVLALRMEDRWFTQNPDVFLRGFVGKGDAD